MDDFQHPSTFVTTLKYIPTLSPFFLGFPAVKGGIFLPKE